MVYAEAWAHGSSTVDKEALRFLVDSLHSFKKATRLSFNLLQDMEAEMPGLLAKLNEEDALSLDLVSKIKLCVY